MKVEGWSWIGGCCGCAVFTLSTWTKRKSLSPIQYQDYFQVEKENENHKSGEARVYVRGYINVNIFSP